MTEQSKIDRLMSIVPPSIPTDEEMRPHMTERWNQQAPAAIDQWPAEIAALSVETILVPIDLSEIECIYEEPGSPEWLATMKKYADQIDEIVGFDSYFIRLSTRSPKDAAYPQLPITMSGKQAMSWIANSERCMDDIMMAKYAQKPIFIALRKEYHAAKGGEFRCYVKDRKLIAVSRYDFDQPAMRDYSGLGIMEALTAFSDKHIAPHYDNIVFDVDMGVYDHEGPLLIEVNPYGLSHPCLFSGYEEIETEGGFRF